MARRRSGREKSSVFKKFGCLLLLLLMLTAVAGVIHRTPGAWNRISSFTQDRISAISTSKVPEGPQNGVPVAPTPTQKVQSQYDNLSFGVPGKADTIIDSGGAWR